MSVDRCGTRYDSFTMKIMSREVMEEVIALYRKRLGQKTEGADSWKSEKKSSKSSFPISILSILQNRISPL